MDFGPILELFVFSGVGLFLFYRTFMNSQWTLLGTAAMTDEHAKQIVYHLTFGTYKEDFGILSQITKTGTWYQRSQMGDCFINASKDGSPVKFNPVIQTKFAKMVQANQSEFFVNTQVQCTSLRLLRTSTLFRDFKYRFKTSFTLSLLFVKNFHT